MNIGVAAHITAASKGGPRYDETMSQADRRDISNGIWLCQNHAKEIDNDETTYTASTLREIKKRAEHAASQALTGELDCHPLKGDPDVLGVAFTLLNKPENWRDFDGEEKRFYCVHQPQFTVREGETIKEHFKESWMQSFPKPYGHSYQSIVYWHENPIHRTTFVSCDGGRYSLPIPQPNGTGGWQIRKRTLAYRIARLYRQHFPLDSTLAQCGIQVIID